MKLVSTIAELPTKKETKQKFVHLKRKFKSLWILYLIHWSIVFTTNHPRHHHQLPNQHQHLIWQSDQVFAASMDQLGSLEIEFVKPSVLQLNSTSMAFEPIALKICFSMLKLVFVTGSIKLVQLDVVDGK